ncbi:LamG domain-containing protein [Bythopirellula polymerisocia]|nr:LamG domain-containing protein [Bythopirellula polymerisocia]
MKYLVALLVLVSATYGRAETTALWLFDEPTSAYPSSVLDSSSMNDYPLVLGQGARLVSGKFGNALAIIEPPPLDYPTGTNAYGLKSLWQMFSGEDDRMFWHNSFFSALMTAGENHLRKEVGFCNPVDTRLNLGDFDWTVEFWYRAAEATEEMGIVFELGLLPNSGKHATTSLALSADRRNFIFRNDPSETKLSLATEFSDETWHHFAFVFSANESQMTHYVDGKLQPLPAKCQLESLPAETPSYLSLGRNNDWQQPLPGCMDELRFSVGQIYRGSFRPPASFAPQRLKFNLQSGPALLFDNKVESQEPIRLGNRKHLFIDDSLLTELDNVKFVVNPPRRAELVIGDIRGSFRKHLTVVDDPQKLIRIYNSVEKDHLAVRVSQDGIHFSAPGTMNSREDSSNQAKSSIVIAEMVGGMGNPFIDPNGPAEERWKYFSDYHRRGIYLYTSPDGYQWRRNKTATLPFRSGTQSCTFYDDQRQVYVSYHRSGIHQTPAGDTERSSVMTEHKDLAEPVEFTPLSQGEYRERQAEERIRNPLPWYLDNGPLTPGDFGLEFPHAFRPIAEDPPGTDIYVTKAQKYPWAPDTYLAFPIVYFHYWPDGPTARHALVDPLRGRGSGCVETQLAVSRNGTDWQRYPRPAYVGIGRHADRNVVNAYIAHGMVRRGDEIWQYYFGETQYHSAYRHDPAGRGVYRLVQRLDGFVSLDSPYEGESMVVTKPLTFDGNRLTLNIDTDATGYAQIGLLDSHGAPIPGFSVDECIYVNGDFIDTEVAWLEKGNDLSDLQGKTIQLVMRMRGSKLFAMQFVDR